MQCRRTWTRRRMSRTTRYFRFRGRFAIGISWFHRFPGVSAFSGHVAPRPSRTECHGTPHSCSNTGGSVHQPEPGVSGMNQACLVALISASSSYGSLRPRRLGAMCRSGSRPPTVQPSIDLIRVEGLGSKVIAQPFTGVVVLGMIFLLKCFKQLGKPRRSPGVFGWTLSLSRDTHLSKRFISEQYTFEEQFVPPGRLESSHVLPWDCVHFGLCPSLPASTSAAHAFDQLGGWRGRVFVDLGFFVRWTRCSRQIL